ncbi:50S ribosomal protein L11 methyltransferase [Thermobrachium celere]|uniref:50S ribosomal protein L11 methyltransferase n=1 Tax=Thermobrachium celere TaxID=53422 RepID=UPI0019418B18|nr:50S ribosomal protein L11 methyltransferase [Thermobrachium celere]GFR34518.1 ribosomal protein L11 methyltransferase [Thermobrachium celere]
MNGEWIEVKVITKSEAIEPITGIFYSLDVKGVAIEDPNDITERPSGPFTWDYADYNIFEYGNEAAIVKAYFSNEDNLEEIIRFIDTKLAELRDMGIDIGMGKILSNKVLEQDWANAWKKYYKTTKIGNNIIIKPRWEEYTSKQNEIVVELDPGMAFGTGTHETTMMCIEFLEKYIKEGDRVFDIGTGSGILAIVAAKLGASEVIGVDLDEVAVDAAKINVQYNKTNNVKIIHGNLVDVVEGRADVVVANIIADVVIYLSSFIGNYINDNGLFISSGIIKDKKQEVEEALKQNGFKIKDVNEKGEWVAIVAQK